MRPAVWILLSTAWLHAAVAAGPPQQPPVPPATSLTHVVADFAAQVAATRDNHGLPFLVVDKVQATVWVFAANGTVLGSTAALLGLAVGDDTVVGIGDRKLVHILPAERTTPAGRFASSLGLNLAGQTVLWVDYDSGVSLHRVIRGHSSEQRASRLASATPHDNRISYGCINVPASFFNTLLLPAVRAHGTIVYVLPETRPWQQVFSFLAQPTREAR